MGLTIGHSPEELNENYLKYFKLSKQWGVYNRRTPREELISLSVDPLSGDRYLERGLPGGVYRVKRQPLRGEDL